MYELKLIVNFFLVLGLAAFLSLCCASVGFLVVNSNPFILLSKPPIQVTGKTDVTRYQFAGYSSWSQFTQNCCCQQPFGGTTNSTSLASSEVWKCLPSGGGIDNPNNLNAPFVYKVPLRTFALTLFTLAAFTNRSYSWQRICLP